MSVAEKFEEKIKLERERIEKLEKAEKAEKAEKERIEKEKDKAEKAEKIEREKVEKAEKVEKERVEKERIEKEKKREEAAAEKEKEKEKSVLKDDEPSTSPTPSTSATSSVTGGPTAAKKEKTKKKPPENKKKKDEVTEKKEIIVTTSKSQAPSGPSISDDVPIEIDDRLKVYYRGSSDYEAKVLDITTQDGKSVYKVHYKGWNARYDEWIQRESIAENLTKDEAKKKQSNSSSSSSNNNSQKTPSTSSTNLQTPTSKNASKRARNRADTTASSRSTTPLSNTSSSKTKLPQKRPTRGTPTSKGSNRGSIIDDNSSESDEPIKKPSEKKEKLSDDKSSTMSSTQKSAEISASDQLRSELKSIKDLKSSEKSQAPEASKSDDEKSTKSSIKSGKSDVKGKLKTIQRDSSRSSFHSTDSDSSHSVPSDVPNSSKSAYTSENESNEPEKISAAAASSSSVITKPDAKKSSFRFDEDASDVKNHPSTALSAFFEKAASEKVEVKPPPTEVITTATTSTSLFPTKKANIFQEKKLAQKADTTKLGRFGQLEKSLAKEIGKAKGKDVKSENKVTESDIYEFKDTEEFSVAKVVSTTVVNKKQESPNEPTKKQQLAQQRKQARQQAMQKEIHTHPTTTIIDASLMNPMEDIESMIKTSIVSLPLNKKQKKSPVKEEKIQPQHSMIVARTPVATASSATTSQQQNVIVQSQPWNISSATAGSSSSSSSNTQDHYSKSQVQAPTQTTPMKPMKSESTFDVLRKSPSFNMQHHADDFSPVKPQLTSSSRNTAGPVKFISDIESRDLLKPIMVPSKEDTEKPELEAFKKILDTTFEILPKAEKSTSIADKLLKAINQKEAAGEREAAAASASASSHFDIVKKEELQSFVKIEERKIDPYTFKAKSPPVTKSSVITPTAVMAKKPMLISSSSESTKSDDKAKGNVELQGIIEKLESAISTPITSLDPTSSTSISSQFVSIKKQKDDDSDTDSDRLVIEDETPTELESGKKQKSQMGVLESIMMQDDVPYKHNNNPSSKETERKSESGEQQSETMSLLLCEETIPGSPAPASGKDPLSEIGRSPTSSSSGGFVHPSMPQSGYTMKYAGSMTTALLHQQYQSSVSHQPTNLKQIPMDIDNDVGMAAHEAATGDILRDKLKSERSSATSSGNNTNNNSDNSNDDQSESEKNGEF